MHGAPQALDMRILKLLENIVRAIGRSVGYDRDFQSFLRIIQGKQVSDSLSQQRRTVVDSKDDAYRRKDRSLPLRSRLPAAAHVHPQRISGVGVKQEACRKPECIRVKVDTTHLILIVLGVLCSRRTTPKPEGSCPTLL